MRFPETRWRRVTCLTKGDEARIALSNWPKGETSGTFSLVGSKEIETLHWEVFPEELNRALESTFSRQSAAPDTEQSGECENTE